ncbi:electron transfer flavoprotein-ubiquinone oxidoreductase [Vibrio atypicus]|uniref:electron transfer flavoprotein-ubiquinone oxidoreductase n=1 Tax=Vibrio atypicus TaxID=558271 RepID=UPI00373616E0
MERESMEFDVVIVGAGPAGLSAACRLAQRSHESGDQISICVLEKGSEVGAHILSGAVFEPRALNELFPDWQQNPPTMTQVKGEEFLVLTSEHNHIKMPQQLIPNCLRSNKGQYVLSLGKLCQWLADKAEAMGVEIFAGFSAKSLSFNDENRVTGIITSDMGLDKNGHAKSGFQPGIELKAKYTIFAEGARGHLGKELIRHYDLDVGKQPQHYALGIKELWQLDKQDTRHQAGKVLHGLGWPLSQSDSNGGCFLYHLDDHQIAVGLITDLNYSNPYVSPFEEFQRLKHHPAIAKYLRGAKRICFGARALAKGGLFSLPKQQFPGGLLIGCDAGTLNSAKIKGSHTAMKSGMLAAEAIFDQLTSEQPQDEPDYQTHFAASWLYEELDQARNFTSAIHNYGSIIGGVLTLFEHNIWPKITTKRVPWNIQDSIPDHLCLKRKSTFDIINYPKPDKTLSFDKPSSVYLSATQHEENQPCHLLLENERIAIDNHLPMFDEPSQRFCPAGVYELVEVDGQVKLQINAANCLHCKTCDIKDPSQNITWVPPESGGPNYKTM